LVCRRWLTSHRRRIDFDFFQTGFETDAGRPTVKVTGWHSPLLLPSRSSPFLPTVASTLLLFKLVLKLMPGDQSRYSICCLPACLPALESMRHGWLLCHRRIDFIFFTFSKLMPGDRPLK
jgi:hypothetical protein